jgi:3-methylcrotonyl-CoA carboxylase alpha subunit
LFKCSYCLHFKPRLPDVDAQDASHAGYTAPMPGKVLKVSVKEGDKVKKGDLLITLFSMKMEHKIYALKDGTVKVFVKENQIADAGQSLVSVE